MYSLTKFVKKRKVSLVKKRKALIKEAKKTETRLIWLLNFLSIQKIVFLAMVYKNWIDLSQTGFDNTYGVFSLIASDSTIKNPLNENGSLIFQSYLFILILYTIFKCFLLIDKENIDYINLLDSIKRKLSNILRLGTLFLMVALYINELSFSEIDRTLVNIISDLLLFLLFYFLEKVVLVNIEKRIKNDLKVNETDIYTLHGVLKNIPLFEFKNESNWKSYVVKTRMTHFDFLVSEDKTGEFRIVEKLALKKVVSNHEIDLHIPLENTSKENLKYSETFNV